MKTYGQYCAVARGLDVVGDRWTLLIVRELLDGPRRYGELREGLPGVATNLLGDRLKALVEAGVVDHDDGRYTLPLPREGAYDLTAVDRGTLATRSRILTTGGRSVEADLRLQEPVLSPVARGAADGPPRPGSR